jgi:hypothetical protein
MAGSEPMVTEFPTVTVPATVWVAGKLRTETEPVTAPKVVLCDAGKLETETTPPLTALAMFAIAVEPRETTVWATMCSPPVTTEERVVADWFPSKTDKAI